MTNTTTMIENASDMVMAILYFLQSLMCLFLLSQLQRRREQKRIRKYFFLLCFTAGMLRCLWFAIPDSVFAQGYLPQNRTPTDFGGQAFLLNLLQFSLYSAPNILYFTMWCLLICFWSSLIHLMFSSLQSPSTSSAQSTNQSMENGLHSPFSSPIRGGNENGSNGVLVVKPFAGGNNVAAEAGPNAPSPVPYPASSNSSAIPRARLIPYTPALNFFRITTIVVCILQLLLIGGLFLFDFFTVLVVTCVFVSTLALFSLVCYITYAIVTLKKLRPMYMRWYEQHESRKKDSNAMLFKDSIHQPFTPNRTNSSFPELEEEDEHVDHRAAARLIRSPLEHSAYPGHASSGLDRDESERGVRGSAYRSQLDRPNSRSGSHAGNTSSSGGDRELSVSPSHSTAVLYQSLHASTNPPPNFHLMNRASVPVGAGSLAGASANPSSILRQPSISSSVSHGPNPSLASSSGHSSLPSQTRTSNSSTSTRSTKSSERSTVSQPNQHISASDELSYQPHSYDDENEDDDEESELEEGDEEHEDVNGSAAVPIAAAVESKEDSNLANNYVSGSDDEELEHAAGPDGALPLNGHRSLRSSPVDEPPQQLLQQQLPPIPQPISSNRSSLSPSPILRVDKEATITQSAVQARLSAMQTDDDAVVREEDFFMASPGESPQSANIPAALRRPTSANSAHPDDSQYGSSRSNNRSQHRYATPPRNSHLTSSIAVSPLAASPRTANSSAIVDKEIDAERYIALYSWNQTRRICMLTLCVTLCGGARIVSSLVELHYTLRQIDDANANPTGDGSSDFPDYWWLYIDSYYLLFELLSSSVATWILTQSSVKYAASQLSSTAEHNHGINQPAAITIIPSSSIALSGSSASSAHRYGTSAPTTPQRVQVKSSYQYPSDSPTHASNASVATFGYYSSSLGGSAMLGPHSSSALSSSLQVRLLGNNGGISSNNQHAVAIASSKISPRLHHHYTSAGSTPVFVASDSQRRENLRQIFKP